MQEKGPYVEEYLVLSPLERKEKYKKFWQTLPFNSFRDSQKEIEHQEMDPVVRDKNAVFENPFETQSRRENSEVLIVMLNRMNSLLSIAEITPTFRKFILDGYKLCYLMGAEEGNVITFTVTPGKDPEGSTLLWTIDDEYPENAGIFDLTRSMSLDRRGYGQLFESYSFTESIMKKAAEERGIDLDTARKNLGESNDEKVLKQWRKEFIERYQDEP